MIRRKQANLRFHKSRIIIVSIFAAFIYLVGAVSYRSPVTVNGRTPFLQARTAKATHSYDSGHHRQSVASCKVKGTRTPRGNVIDPAYTFNKGELESLQVVNGDYSTNLRHNFNPEYNVNAKDLDYFGSESITLAGRVGIYYYSIHTNEGHHFGTK